MTCPQVGPAHWGLQNWKFLCSCPKVGTWWCQLAEWGWYFVGYIYITCTYNIYSIYTYIMYIDSRWSLLVHFIVWGVGFLPTWIRYIYLFSLFGWYCTTGMAFRTDFHKVPRIRLKQQTWTTKYWLNGDPQFLKSLLRLLFPAKSSWPKPTWSFFSLHGLSQIDV